MPSLPKSDEIVRKASETVALTAFGLTDAGKVRDHNEDAFLCDTGLGVLVVADGLGGLARGEVASFEVVSSVSAALARGNRLEEGLEAAHSKLVRMAADARGQSMGSTVVALSWKPGEASLSVVWVGDSRAYLWRDGALQQLSRDHSLVQELLDLKLISAADAEHHPNRNVITRALGVRSEQPLQIDSAHVSVQPGDRLLLCSDGLSTYLPEARIRAVMAEGADDEHTVRRLVQLTLDETAAADNVTVICATVLSPEAAPSSAAIP